MLWLEYMKIKMGYVPQEIHDEYDIANKITNDRFYVEITKSMYGLPQAGIQAKKLLQKRLVKYGFQPKEHTPSL